MTNISRHPGGPPTREIVLYTRSGCHLCEDAEAILAQFGLRPRKVDIDGDPELTARHGTCVPVVEIDGRVRFRGRVDRTLLQRLLRATAASAAPAAEDSGHV